MKKCILVMLLVISCAAVPAIELDALLTDKDLWSRTSEDFVQTYGPMGFTWLSGEQHTARTRTPNLTLFGAPVVEADVLFDAGQPKEFICNAYTRGDSGARDKEGFGAELDKWKKALMAYTKTQPREEKAGLVSSGVKQKVFVWKGSTGSLRLIYSYSTKDQDGRLGFRAEFIRITWSRPANSLGARNPLLPNRGGPAGAAEVDPVTRDENGDVYLAGIPMVNQGDKGYCAVATTERVMRFYGLDVDQHQIAQLASSSAAGGTSPDAMVKALKRAGSKLGCRIRVLEDLDIKEVLDRIRRYNKQAKRAHQPEIVFGQMIDVGAVYRSMNFEVLKESRLDSRVQFSKFKSTIERYIDEGTPLAWSVVLGLVAETPPLHGALGGHMRLIIGYNNRTEELLYSDSWGQGHEFKRMPAGDAWAITTGLYAIEKR